MNAMILLAPNVGDFFFSKDPVALARETLKAGKYNMAGAVMKVDGDAEEVAEELFDLTNNPSRQDEREEKYGRLRSVSVGDVIVVGEDFMLCMSSGWEKL